MKIAKITIEKPGFFAVPLLVVALGLVPVSAQAAPAASMPPSAAPAAAPPAAVADHGSVAPSAAPMPPSALPPPPSANAIKLAENKDKKDGKDEKGLAALETGIPKAVKDVVRHLSNSTDDISLGDLNSARQAIAKLDVLIDLEKRLADYEKLRNKGASNAMARAIPASALRPPPSMRPPVHAPEPAATPVMSGMVQVERITGINGSYTAKLHMPNGETKNVHAGDHLSDGSNVVAITADGVELEKGKTRRLVQVKGVEMVFGASR